MEAAALKVLQRTVMVQILPLSSRSLKNVIMIIRIVRRFTLVDLSTLVSRFWDLEMMKKMLPNAER